MRGGAGEAAVGEGGVRGRGGVSVTCESPITGTGRIDGRGAGRGQGTAGVGGVG